MKLLEKISDIVIIWVILIAAFIWALGSLVLAFYPIFLGIFAIASIIGFFL